VDQTGYAIVITGGEFEICMDPRTGVITSWEAHGLDLIESGPELQVWRAPTDNDVWIAGKWREVGLDHLETHVYDVRVLERGPDRAVVEIPYIFAANARVPAFRCTATYTIDRSGEVLLEEHVVPTLEIETLPRLGVQMMLPEMLNRVTWYGRGPHENYVDRKESGRIGRWSAHVDALQVPYIMPQENGGRTDVLWAALTDDHGRGLLAMAEGSMTMTASRYTTEMLTQAKHTYELEPCGGIVLTLDHGVCGLGSASCGPRPLDKYLLRPAETTFRYRLRPILLERMDPMTLCRLGPGELPTR